MTAKQSSAQVQRARKRRSLRAELRARCGVFNETDHGESENAPEGWCEIQRNDSIDVDGYDPFASDEHAALAVAHVGDARGTAMLYETCSGLYEPIPLDGCSVSQERWDSLNEASSALGGGADWICIVPRVVAKAAGLLP